MSTRREFLKTTGMAGIFSVLPFASAFSKTNEDSASASSSGSCTLIPSETAGPFPFDLTENNTFFRQDIRESKTGVQLNLKMKILGVNNCEPMQNLRVNIWHCDKDGLYSGYSVNNNAGQAGLTYLRGYQITDANGEVNFVTIFPGWYTGRICHIHFQVYVSSVYAAISQLTFDISEKNSIYSANPTLYPKGTDPTSLASDNIFSDGYNYQIASLTPNSSTGGYDAYLEVAIQGSGTGTGLGSLEPETGGEFKLGQNYPNPYNGETVIPFNLKQLSDVTIELWDLNGRKIIVIESALFSKGNHERHINLTSLGLTSGNYIYQIVVSNSKGTFRQYKMMTFMK